MNPTLDIIAERELQLTTEVATQTILIQVGRPQRDPEPGGDWICPFVISDLGVEELHWAAGVDSMQALLLAIQMIDIQLRNSGSLEELSWFGGADLGIPNLFAMP
jgi:hypothetical protein